MARHPLFVSRALGLVSLALATSSSCTLVVDDKLSSKPLGVDFGSVPGADASADDASTHSPSADLRPDGADGQSAGPVDAAVVPAAPAADAGMPAPAGEAGVPEPLARAQLCVGLKHGCALAASGKITCWGNRDWGQNALEKRSESFVQLSCGDNHTCGITADHNVVCVGSNTDKQTLNTPADGDYAEVAAGALHTCARKSDGKVTCWGAFNSQTGEATAPADKFSAIAAGAQVSCGILDVDHSIRCWGSADQARNRPPAGAGFSALDLGGGQGCAINRAEELSCWGAASEKAPKLVEVRALSVGASGRGCAQAGAELLCWYGSAPLRSFGGTAEAFAAGASAVCTLPRAMGQLLCDTDAPEDEIKNVPRPYPS